MCFINTKSLQKKPLTVIHIAGINGSGKFKLITRRIDQEKVNNEASERESGHGSDGEDDHKVETNNIVLSKWK